MDISLLSCLSCESLYVPPRYVCAHCGKKEFNKRQVEGSGELVAFTRIHVAPPDFIDQVPYTVILVKLNKGLNISGRLVEEKDGLQIGMKLNFKYQNNLGYWFD